MDDRNRFLTRSAGDRIGHPWRTVGYSHKNVPKHTYHDGRVYPQFVNHRKHWLAQHMPAIEHEAEKELIHIGEQVLMHAVFGHTMPLQRDRHAVYDGVIKYAY